MGNESGNIRTVIDRNSFENRRVTKDPTVCILPLTISANWCLRAFGCIDLREFAKSVQRTFLEISGPILGKVQRSLESASVLSPTRRSESSSCGVLVQLPRVDVEANCMRCAPPRRPKNRLTRREVTGRAGDETCLRACLIRAPYSWDLVCVESPISWIFNGRNS